MQTTNVNINIFVQDYFSTLFQLFQRLKAALVKLKFYLLNLKKV